jgi:hypothetical protein
LQGIVAAALGETADAVEVGELRELPSVNEGQI